MQKVIYTCIVGGYDELLQPKVIYDGYDYICFTNDLKVNKIGVWEIRPIPFKHKDKTRLSRFVKLNPHIALPEYEYSVWIDSNIQIIDSYLYDRTEILIRNGTLMSMVKHPDKNCIYVDAKICVLEAAKDSFSSMNKQMKFLRHENYPQNNGLFENNLILRKHNEKIIVKISKLWWEVYMKFSKRDQMSLCYVFWKNNFIPDLLLPQDVNTHNKEHFVRYQHKESFCFRIKRKCRLINNRLSYMLSYPKYF